MDPRRTAACAVSLAAFVSPAFAVPALAQAPTERTITANGTAAVKPEPTDRRSNASIRRAMAEAREAGVGKAVADARERARRLADEAGLTLGAVISVADFPFEDFESQGAFGPDQFCGKIRRPIYRQREGRRRVVGYRTRRICRVPDRVTSRVAMTFSAS